MGTIAIQDGVVGGYIPLAGPAVDGEGPVGHAVRMRRLATAGIPADMFAHVEPAEDETPAEAVERLARLRAAKDDPKWDCPRCGAKGARWDHEDYPELCKPTGGMGMSDRYEGRTLGPIPLDYDNAFKRRHPCEVTADRLLSHLERWPEQFDGSARDEIARIRFLLQTIAEEGSK